MVGFPALLRRREEDHSAVPSRELPDGYKGPRSPDQAAEWLTANGLPMSGSTVRREVERRNIKASRTSKKKGAWLRIRQSELERYLRDNL